MLTIRQIVNVLKLKKRITNAGRNSDGPKIRLCPGGRPKARRITNAINKENK